MPNRLRLMMGATALLYLGPLLAGLGGYGWRVVPVFVAIFLLWTLILRPATWPQSRADWTRADLMIGLAAQSAMQGLVVVVSFGIGRGLGGVVGALPAFPVMLPVAISFLSIPLCRLLWNPRKMAEMDRFLDTAIDGIKSATTPPETSAIRAQTARLLAPLQALPDTTSEDEIARHLAAILSHAAPADVAQALLAAVGQGTASPVGRRALVLVATDPALNPALAGSDMPARAFHLIAADPALALLYARRSAAQLRADPGVWWDSVSPENLRSAAASLPPEPARALTDLATLTESLAPPDHVHDRQHAQG